MSNMTTQLTIGQRCRQLGGEDITKALEEWAEFEKAGSLPDNAWLRTFTKECFGKDSHHHRLIISVRNVFYEICHEAAKREYGGLGGS